MTSALLADAGLAPEPLAPVRVCMVRAVPSRAWHVAPAPGDLAAGCPRLRRVAERGRRLEHREASILDGLELCGTCAPTLALPGPEGTYLAVVRQILAAGEWVTALEKAAPSADWLACGRWTARTPFADPGVMPALLDALPAGQRWAPARAAAEAAWAALAARAEAGWDVARHAAGPPGLRELAATVCAHTWADPDTQAEHRLLAAIMALPPSRPGWPGDPWAGTSRAWADAVALDADTAAGAMALLAAMETLSADAPVRDVSLLPSPAWQPAGGFSSPADWAQAEYQELCRLVAARWCQRLAGSMAALLDEPADDWMLLRVSGWPLTGDRDRELAYLACYPELGRIPDTGCGEACGRGHPYWTVVLHVPGFAALHAATHGGPCLDIVPGPGLPPGAEADPAHIQAMLALPVS